MAQLDQTRLVCRGRTEQEEFWDLEYLLPHITTTHSSIEDNPSKSLTGLFFFLPLQKMIAARAAVRSTTQAVVARRAFTTTRVRLSSPYHYPEGPYSNLPFDPRKKGFAWKYWTFCFVGFFTPFGIACALPCSHSLLATLLLDREDVKEYYFAGEMLTELNITVFQLNHPAKN